MEDILEDQIGDLGGDAVTLQEQPQEKKGLGKAKIYGVKPEHDSNETPIRMGWIELDRTEFGERGQFYPQDWKFFVKPASVEDIKNWSSIDEERLDQINDVFNEIIKSNLKITSDTGTIGWGKLNDWDRLFILLKIREYTFETGERKISYTEECTSCDHPVTFELTSNSLVFDLPDQDIVNRHWDAEARVWIIDPKEYDVDGPVLKLYIPTIEKDEVIFKWALERARNNKKVNEAFMRFLPWLMPKISRDAKVNEKFINDAEATFKMYGIKMFDFADEVLRNIIVTPSEKLSAVCSHCGEETESQIRFPNGIRGLFSVPSEHKRFGKK